MRVSREKVALGFFIVLALAALGVLIAYIVSFGHSLNAAATSIDESTGNLDKYTAILYKGTATERHDTVVDPEAVGEKVSSRVLNKLSTQNNNNHPDNEVSASDMTDSQTKNADAKDAASGQSSADAKPQQPLSVFELQRSYVDKHANVFTLDVEHPQQYNESCVWRAGKYTFGILSIDQITANASYFEKRIHEYKAMKVDFIICVVSDLSLLDSYKGANIVISTQDEGLSADGVSVDGIFYDDACMKGKVGTLLISPSRTITARDASSV